MQTSEAAPPAPRPRRWPVAILVAFITAIIAAIATAPVSDPAQHGQIVSVVKEGYVIGDDLLRPASVVVGELREQT